LSARVKLFGALFYSSGSSGQRPQLQINNLHSLFMVTFAIIIRTK